ncbi:suppressor of cytokine signaling 5, isoform CRA_a, partial [Mus musculus]
MITNLPSASGVLDWGALWQAPRAKEHSVSLPKKSDQAFKQLAIQTQHVLCSVSRDLEAVF